MAFAPAPVLFSCSTSQNVKNYYSAPCHHVQAAKAKVLCESHGSRAGYVCGIAVVVDFCCHVLACLNQAAHAQVLLDDDVVDGSHDESDLHRVGCAGKVGVDLLGGMLVEAAVALLACSSLNQS